MVGRKVANNKNYLRKIDLFVLNRVLTVLYNDGNTRKSILARNANISYDKCVRYIAYLKVNGYVEKGRDDDDYEIIRITKLGRDFHEKKLQYLINENYSLN